MEPDHPSFCIISTLSYTSRRVITNQKTTAEHVRMLSDKEILALIRSRCDPGDSFLLNQPRPGLADAVRETIQHIVGKVGRCPVLIHELMDVRLAIPKSILPRPSFDHLPPIKYPAEFYM